MNLLEIRKLCEEKLLELGADSFWYWDVGAFHTLDLLVRDTKEQGVLQIALEATDMGRPLYEKCGFVKMENEMELKE